MTILGIALLVGGLALFALLQDSREAFASDVTSQLVIPAAVEFPAPTLELENLRGGMETLTDYRGQVVLVNNWATWCPPCKAEMPSLQRFYEAHVEEGFTIIAVNAGDEKSTVEQFAESYGLGFNLWLDPNSASLNAFRNGNLPSSYVMDREGIIRYAWTGEISYEMLEKYITPVIQAVN